MKWGEPTWFLFHTLAAKVKDEHFDRIRIELLNNITAICHILPCPMCSEHATMYLKQINYNSIKTKRDLKDFIFKFHNDVNLRKGFEPFPYSELDSKYATANTVKIIHHFMHFFPEKSGNIKLLSNEMYRTRALRSLKDWFSANIQHFDP